jgi:hypothetical protein
MEILGVRVPFHRRMFVAPDGAQEDVLWAAFRGGRVITEQATLRIWKSEWWARLRERRGDGEDNFLRISTLKENPQEIHGDFLEQVISPAPKKLP